MNWTFWKKDKKTNTTDKKAKKSAFQEWKQSVLFAVVAATLLRWLLIEAYQIPTPSMENSLLVGDLLFVSKFHYGSRTPITPLQIPLTHQTIWFTNMPSYLPWIQLPPFRLPGISRVQRQDVVVFNVPGIREDNYPNPNPHQWKDRPIDLKTYYIKRCVAVSGDTLQIIDQQVHLNGEKITDSKGLQTDYIVTATNVINPKNLARLGISSEDAGSLISIREDTVIYNMTLTASESKVLEDLPYIRSVQKITRHIPEENIFPPNRLWNADFYGPIVIPKKGMTILINDSTLSVYGTLIERYDLNQNVSITNRKLYIDNKEISRYTFNQDYYFMMGDNRHNSLDGRYWGFVPANHVVGKALFIWFSWNKEGNIFNPIRWSRTLQIIR